MELLIFWCRSPSAIKRKPCVLIWDVKKHRGMDYPNEDNVRVLGDVQSLSNGSQCHQRNADHRLRRRRWTCGRYQHHSRQYRLGNGECPRLEKSSIGSPLMHHHSGDCDWKYTHHYIRYFTKYYYICNILILILCCIFGIAFMNRLWDFHKIFIILVLSLIDTILT